MKRNTLLRDCFRQTLFGVLLGSALPASGAVLVQVDPTTMPMGASDWDLRARFGGDTSWTGASGYTEGGVPFLLTYVFDCDAVIPRYIEELEFSFICNETRVAYSLPLLPWVLPCLQGPDYPAGVFDFGIDSQVDCDSYGSIPADLQIRVEGSNLVLDWTHAYCIQDYRVYRLDHPWQPIDQATPVGFTDDNHFELPLEGPTGFFRVTSILCD
jgi:hypothetical protein